MSEDGWIDFSVLSALTDSFCACQHAPRVRTRNGTIGCYPQPIEDCLPIHPIVKELILLTPTLTLNPKPSRYRHC